MGLVKRKIIFKIFPPDLILLLIIIIIIYNNNDNNNLTNSYWSIGSTRNVKENKTQTREMGDMESRIQLAPHARRRAVPMTVSEWVPVLCADDEVAKSGRTGMTTAYTEDMLSRERTMDCTMHRLLGENTIY